MKQAKLPDPWKKYAGEFITQDAFLERLYNSLNGLKTGKFIQHNLMPNTVCPVSHPTFEGALISFASHAP